MKFKKGQAPWNISQPQRLQENFIGSIAEQILLGTVIGDSTLVKRFKKGGTYLMLGHCEKQKDYLEWKVKILKDFGVEFSKPYVVPYNKIISYSSKTYQEFNNYYKMFYRGRTKIVRRKVLNLFQPIALAIWIQDDGSMCEGDNIIRLHTECFSDREQKMICGYFASMWHITAKVNWVSKEKNLKCIAFGVNGTKKLIDIIKPFIHPSMEYKIKLVQRMSNKEAIKKWNTAGIPYRFQKGINNGYGFKKGNIPWNKNSLTTT